MMKSINLLPPKKITAKSHGRRLRLLATAVLVTGIAAIVYWGIMMKLETAELVSEAESLTAEQETYKANAILRTKQNTYEQFEQLVNGLRQRQVYWERQIALLFHPLTGEARLQQVSSFAENGEIGLMLDLELSDYDTLYTYIQQLEQLPDVKRAAVQTVQTILRSGERTSVEWNETGSDFAIVTERGSAYSLSIRVTMNQLEKGGGGES